jgi:hypothetical protein
MELKLIIHKTYSRGYRLTVWSRDIYARSAAPVSEENQILYNAEPLIDERFVFKTSNVNQKEVQLPVVELH